MAPMFKHGSQYLAGFVLLFALCWQPPVIAELRIDIVEGVESAIPVAVIPFAQPWRGASAESSIDRVITADLYRSGRFTLTPKESMLNRPYHAKDVDYRDWRLLGVEALIIGQLEQVGDDLFDVRFELLDAIKKQRLTGARYSAVPGNELRRLGHYIADQVFRQLTGVDGVFSTRIAYVASKGGRYGLQVADVDGRNPVGVLSSPEPVMSPSWSANGQYLSYVAFDQGRPAIFTQEVSTGERRKLKQFKGINGAPAWSPDGQELAITLSKDGSPDIFIYRLDSDELTRLTSHYAIDTEPAWSPDGKQIYFTSDRGGGPQIYKISRLGGPAKRITINMGKYNADASVSPDGKYLAVVNSQGRKGYRIGLVDLVQSEMTLLSSGALDESPSFSPNGQLIIYTSTRGNSESLAVVSVDARVRQQLALQHAKVREPSWSPFNR
ncbi:MAG: Tol-Pal system beta propeller repeat protein TolB [Immundisolibacteraceae bacterium]|nr:Tol-Pal system beta propeller repeat protein TolB [Immundisolibacteraceae bacterium]